MYRDANGTESKKMPFQQYDTKYIGGAEIITGGYYYSPEYYACFQIRIDNYVCWLHKSWLKMIENGNEIDNSAIVKVYVYYRWRKGADMIQTNFKGPGEEIKIENEHYTLF